VLVVLVELGALVGLDAIEVSEQVRRVALRLALFGGAPLQLVDDRLGVDLLLDVERRDVDDEVGPVLPVLATPDQLRFRQRQRAGRIRRATAEAIMAT